MAISLQDLIDSLNRIDTSNQSGLDVNWPHVTRALQGLLAYYQGIERAGTIPNDQISSLMLGDGTTRKLRRLVYVPATTTVKIQKNTGTDVSPTWVDLISVDTTGNLTITGSLTGTLPAHVTTHLPGGTDGLPTAAAVSVGSSNTAGTGTNLSLANHGHQGVHSADVDGSGSPFFGDIDLRSGTRITVAKGSNTATFNFTSPNRTYITTKSLGDQSITSSTAKTLVTGLSNLAVPGANSSKNYAVYCVVDMSTTNAALNNITLNIHLGSNGTTGDAVWWSTSTTYDVTAGTKGIMLVCPGVRITPTSSQKLSVSVELGTSTATAHTIQNNDPKYCTLRIEEEL